MRRPSLKSLLHTARTDAIASRRRVRQLEESIADFERTIANLDTEIRAEQDRAGIHDHSHFAYPSYAKAAMCRRDNLARSVDTMRVTLTEATTAMDAAGESLSAILTLQDMRERVAGADLVAS